MSLSRLCQCFDGLAETFCCKEFSCFCTLVATTCAVMDDSDDFLAPHYA